MQPVRFISSVKVFFLSLFLGYNAFLLNHKHDVLTHALIYHIDSVRT